MRKKGKHFKKKESRLNSKIIIRLMFILVIIALVVMVIKNMNREEKNSQEEEKGMEEAHMEEEEEQKTEEVVETSVEPSEEENIIEETIDVKIEELINNIRTKNNLNENNFYFFFYNIEEKKSYYYNENAYFTAASTIKVPVAMMYYDKIEEGTLNISDTLLYTKDDYEEGGGSTAVKYSVGEKIPISYLIEQSIVNSDNTALNILVNREGYEKCKNQLSKYTNIELPETFYKENIANALYYYDVLQYLYQNSEKYSELIGYMKKSSGGIYLKAQLPQYEVAHKYGSYEECTHDYGIIYGKNTYLVGVFTKGVANASDLIASIGKQAVDCAEAEEGEEVE